FRFTDRIPRERGLGSSASVIVLGLLAAIAIRRDPVDVEELLSLGTTLEGHSDNLAAALVGGVCLTWAGRVTRLADGLPATPIPIVSDEQMNTRESRAALPSRVPHEDAAFNVARAALLGASVALNDAELFGEALDDRLHEPYRSELLLQVREALP